MLKLKCSATSSSGTAGSRRPSGDKYAEAGGDEDSALSGIPPVCKGSIGIADFDAEALFDISSPGVVSGRFVGLKGWVSSTKSSSVASPANGQLFHVHILTEPDCPVELAFIKKKGQLSPLGKVFNQLSDDASAEYKSRTLLLEAILRITSSLVFHLPSS